MGIRKNVFLLYAISLLQGMVVYSPIATLYRQAQGISVFEITIIESISLLLALAMELPWGVLADKIGYKKTLLICNGIYVLSKVVFWKADGFVDFLVERLMLSVVIAGLSGVDVSVLYLSARAGESQKAFAIYENLGTVGLFAASLVYALFVGEDYSLAGLLTIIPYGIAFLLTLGLQEVKKNAPTEKPEQIGSVLRSVLCNKKILLFLLGGALLKESNQFFTVFLNQIQYEKCGMSDSLIGYVYILMLVIGLLGGFSYYVTKKVGEKRTIHLTGLSMAMACLVLGFTASPVISVAAVILIRLACNLFAPLFVELRNRQVAHSNRATELSVQSILTSSVGIGINLFYGKLADANLSATFLCGGGICLLAVLLLGRVNTAGKYKEAIE